MNRGQTIDYQTVFLILRKWQDDQAMLRCHCKFGTVTFNLRGRIYLIDTDDVSIASPDALTEITFRLGRAWDALYVEPPHDSKAAEEVVAALVLILPTLFLGRKDDRDRVLLEELREEHGTI